MGLKRAMMIGLDSADPVQVRRLMDEGKMPNLKKLLEEYGVANHNLAMLGALPSVTPPNWCSIATGNLPRTHGVTCYNNATIGSLGMEEFNWTSANVTSDFIWEQFAKEGKRSIMLSYCEAWPPRMTENDLTVMIDGSGFRFTYQIIILIPHDNTVRIVCFHCMRNKLHLEVAFF